MKMKMEMEMKNKKRNYKDHGTMETKINLFK